MDKGINNNKNKNKNNIQIGLNLLDSITTYRAGGTIIGNVFLSAAVCDDAVGCGGCDNDDNGGAGDERKKMVHMMSSFPASCIRLTLKGEEHSVIVSYGDDDEEIVSGEADYRLRHGKSKRRIIKRSIQTFLCTDMDVVKFDNYTIKPNQNRNDSTKNCYEWPFEIELPTNLPSSFRVNNSNNDGSSNNDESFCEIRYELSAYLQLKVNETYSLAFDTNDMDGTCISKNICIIAASTVADDDASKPSSSQHDEPKKLQSTSERKHGVVVQPEEYEIKSGPLLFGTLGLGKKRRGYVKLGWDSSTNSVAPNSILDVGIVGCNRSLENAQRILVQLQEHVSWWDSNNNCSFPNCRKKEIKKTLSESFVDVHDHPNWQRLQALPRRSKVYHCDHDKDINQQQKEINESKSRLQTTLKIPHNALDSYCNRALISSGYNRSSIQVRHHIVVTLEMSKNPNRKIDTIPKSTSTIQIQRPQNITILTSKENAFLMKESSCAYLGSSSTSTRSPLQQEGDEELAISGGEAGHSGKENGRLTTTSSSSFSKKRTVRTSNVTPKPTVSATTIENNNNQEGEIMTASTKTKLTPSEARATTVVVVPSLDDLLHDLLSSSSAMMISPVNYIKNEWMNISSIVVVIQNMTPIEYASFLLGCEQQNFVHDDIVGIAKQIALIMDLKFKSRHVLQCIRTLPPYIRWDIIKDIAILSSDLNDTKEQEWIEKQMNNSTELLYYRSALR